MIRQAIIALLVGLIAAPAGTAAETETTVLQVDGDEFDLRTENRLTGSDAARFREEIDGQGDGDGIVTAAEVTRYNSENRVRFDTDQSDCFRDFELARLDSKPPLRVSEVATIARDATGAVTSTAPALRIESVLFRFPNPRSDHPTAAIRMGDMGSMAALGCAMGQGFGNFWGAGWGESAGPDASMLDRDRETASAQQSSSRDSDIPIEPRGPAVMERASIQPTALQAAWTGRGILADSDPERSTVMSSRVTFTIRGGAVVDAGDGGFTSLSPLGYVAGALALAGVGLVLATEVGRFQLWKWLVLLPGFSRLEKDEVLVHAKRDQLYQFIRSNPGPSFSDLRRELDLSNGTLVHHLRILESQEYVKTVRDGFRTRFYVRGPKIVPTSYLTRTQQSILDAIGANPGLTQKDLSQFLGLPRESVSYHTKRLADNGQLEIRQEGKWRRYWVKVSGPPGVDAPRA